jgi:hypothetical protein
LHRANIDLRILATRLACRGGKTLGGVGCDFKLRFLAKDPDAPDFLARHMAAPTQEWQQPTRVGITITPNIHAEPHAGCTAWRIRLISIPPRFAPFGALFGDFLGRRQRRAQHFDQRCRQGVRRNWLIRQQPARKRQIIFRCFFGQNAARLFRQAFRIAREHGIG